MSMKEMTIGLALLLWPVAAWSETVTAHRDIPYAMPKRVRQTLDVYTGSAQKDPASARPVVIWIHGGGWQQGDKSTLAGVKGRPEQHPLKPKLFVDAGYVFVAMNYRFIPEVSIQDMAGDVAKAIGWVYHNAREYGGNPDALFVLGHSAGAQLAALVCTDARYLGAEQLSLGNIRGCVPLDGDTYFPALQIYAPPQNEVNYRKKFPAGFDIELSSVVQVYRNKNIPPFLLIHIADDPKSGTAIQAQVLAKSLHDVGVSAELLAIAGKTHVTLQADMGSPHDPTSEAILAFVRRNTPAR